jgi:predicted DNA-binding WGR domain protein
MEDKETYEVHLHRIDAAKNMRRYYRIAIQPTLFGEASVIRNWGRIGSGGQTMMETFDHPDDADTALSCLERTKRRRGYRDAGSAK